MCTVPCVRLAWACMPIDADAPRTSMTSIFILTHFEDARHADGDWRRIGVVGVVGRRASRTGGRLAETQEKQFADSQSMA